MNQLERTHCGPTPASNNNRMQWAIHQLENVAIANALQLEAARRRAVSIRFNFAAHVKFELAQPIRCRLRAFYCLYVTLRCDLEL